MNHWSAYACLWTYQPAKHHTNQHISLQAMPSFYPIIKFMHVFEYILTSAHVYAFSVLSMCMLVFMYVVLHELMHNLHGCMYASHVRWHVRKCSNVQSRRYRQTHTCTRALYVQLSEYSMSLFINARVLILYLHARVRYKFN